MFIAAQGSMLDTQWTESGENYSILVQFPDIALENEMITGKLEEHAFNCIDAFKDNLPIYAEENPSDTCFSMELTFTQEPAPDSMICILANSWNYIGGPHYASGVCVFLLDQRTETFMRTIELLGGEDELRFFLKKVRVLLFNMMTLDAERIRRRTYNYNAVLPVPNENGGIAGYKAIFPPYYFSQTMGESFEVFVPVE